MQVEVILHPRTNSHQLYTCAMNVTVLYIHTSIEAVKGWIAVQVQGRRVGGAGNPSNGGRGSCQRNSRGHGLVAVKPIINQVVAPTTLFRISYLYWHYITALYCGIESVVRGCWRSSTWNHVRIITVTNSEVTVSGLSFLVSLGLIILQCCTTPSHPSRCQTTGRTAFLKEMYAGQGG